MLHERIVAESGSALPDATRGTRDALSEIIAGIDDRFTQVGCTLATTVEAIDRIASCLQQVGNAFETGEAATSVDNLTGAADRLSDVSSQLGKRTGEVTLVRTISKTLNKDVADVHKALEVLQIYAINVKIAASGADAFVDFADRMKAQLIAGEHHISGFNGKLGELEHSLAGMESSDERLATECAKVVPHVPERLIADATELRAHQTKLARLARETGDLALSIQGNVANVLGAIQIGDIVRQRLEHVLTGCALLEAQLPGCDPAEGAATRHHMTRIFVAQLFDTAADFRREMELLAASLRQIEPKAARLLALQKGEGAGADGQAFLRRLEKGIAEADTMTAQLRLADRQADETIHIIIDTVNDLAVRAAAMRNLRIDVQQMAINIGLRCRRVEAIGRPVTIVANEIRGYSERLDATIDNITTAAGDLNGISLRMQDSINGNEARSADDLACSLEAIREGAKLTEKAMASAGSDVGDVFRALRRTADQLEEGLDLGGTIDAIASSLSQLAGPEVAISEFGGNLVRMLMAELGRSYTMAREREIHDQFRLADMACLVSAPAASNALENDDDLFDDALF
jgi:hypothetical protein